MSDDKTLDKTITINVTENGSGIDYDGLNEYEVIGLLEYWSSRMKHDLTASANAQA